MAVVDSDTKKARKVGTALGARWYTDLDAMLEKEEVDCVSIATPDHLHRRHAESCLRAGKDVLLEKPISTNLSDADHIISVEKKSGVKLMVNFLLRFDPRYAIAKDRIQGGTIGEIASIWARRNVPLKVAKKYNEWASLPINVISHDLDMINWFTGQLPERLYAEASNKVFKSKRFYDAIMAVLKFKDGTIASVETNWLLPTRNAFALDSRMHVIGTTGSIYIDFVNTGLTLASADDYSYPDTSFYPVYQGRVWGDLKAAVGHFLECVLFDRKPSVGSEDARDALRVGVTLKESCSKGEVVRIL